MPKYVDGAGLERFYGNIKEREVQTFDTVAAMQAATYLEAGMTCHTNGFYASGDGGAAYYTISASGTIACANSLYATKIEVLSTMSGFSESSANNLGIFKCVKSWLDNNDRLYYGNSGNPNSYVRTNGVNALVTSVKDNTEVDGKYPIDCMSFITMCLLGIGFEESIFGDGSNKAKYPRSTIPFLSDAFYRYSHHMSDGTWSALSSNEDWTRVTSWQFAEYLNDRGLYHGLDGNVYGKLRIGDIVFIKSNDTAYENRFEKIVHVGIYLGIGRFGMHTICDCTNTNADYPVRVRDYDSTNMVGYARIPVGTGSDFFSQSVAEPHNALVRSESHTNERVTLWLDRPIERWGTYLVRYVVTYTDASLIGVNFPALKILPLDYMYARFSDNAHLPTFEVNVPKCIEQVVCLSPELRDLDTVNAQQYLSLAMYPNVTSGYNLRVLEVVPIISSEPSADSEGAWVPQIEAATLQDAVDALNTNLVAANTYASLSGKVMVSINGGAPLLYMYRFIRPRSADRLIALFRGDRTGVARQDYGGNTTYTTYTTSSPVPFEWYM